MKITEVIQPTANEIFESIAADSEHTFTKETLLEISQNVANFSKSSATMTMEEFFQRLDKL